MDFKKLVIDARSCRRFLQDKPLTAAELEWLVDCARQSPCARNAQVLRFVLVHTPEKCAEVFPKLRFAGALKDWGGPHEGEKPTGYIALVIPKAANSLVHNDVGIAAQTIQLGATSNAWGCCMLASFERPACSALLDIPENMEISLILALGVAKEERQIAPMPASGEFAYWRDASGIHYVPKRPLSEVILNKF